MLAQLPWVAYRASRIASLLLSAYPSSASVYADRRFDPRHHMLLEYERETMFNPRGRTTGPRPHGMSGGGAWTIDLLGFRRLDRPRLVSILIEYHGAPHHAIISTRVGLCIDVIGDHFPELTPLLPKPSACYGWTPLAR